MMDDNTILETNAFAEDAQKQFSDRYTQAKSACRKTLDRLKADLSETGGNPYLRATSIVRYEILHSPQDEEPVDVFEYQKSNGCYLRTLALAAGVLATVEVLSLRAKIKKAKKRK